MEKGYLSLVLHAHLPFVHHPESENYIEERWLFEAITETYIPLLDVFEGLVRDGVPFQLTMSMTPTLVSMLASPLLQRRYLHYLNNLISLADKEVRRLKEDEALLPLAAMYLRKFKQIHIRFREGYGCNLIKGFKALSDSGHLELMTSSATHAILPYIQTEQALRAQIENAVKVHAAHFGKAPKGIWLPECAYKGSLDRILTDYGLRYFLTDSHALQNADPEPIHGVYAPVLTPGGLAVFARDQETSKQVWSAQEGYPGDYDYREYYRDIGFDLDLEYLKPHMHPSGVRLNTRIKYHRITGNDGAKDVYNPDWARSKAGQHAGHFMFNREHQINYLSSHMDRKPIVVAAYDAELFGHWWYEGPMWLDQLCRKIHAEQQTFKLATPRSYLQEYPENQECELSFSTWGRGGYGEVWLNDMNQWIYRELHRMEERMIELSDRFPEADGTNLRAINQAARELLLAQSSDWAFIMDNGTMVDYAIKRTNNHVRRFDQLYDMLSSGQVDEEWLTEVERRDALFPAIDYRIFFSDPNRTGQPFIAQAEEGKRALKVLMLSWEYPPMMVGGLSRHVYDLSQKLAEQGTEVHVLTCHVEGAPAYEQVGGVHIHRIRTYQAGSLSFMEWVFQLNLAMADYGANLIRHYGSFDLIHAHDWLMNKAAKALKHQFRLPLVATIHATEHGRNRGIYTDLQRSIHGQEWELAYEAWRVIVCSDYMKEELQTLFQVPADKLDVVPNGVNPELVQVPEIDASIRDRFALPWEKMIFFVGRIVTEKGVQVLLDSVPAVLAACPDAKFVIAGKGPMLEELKHRASGYIRDGKVIFTGFIDDYTRNQLFHMAHVTVFPSLYEPFGIVALEAMAAGTPVIVSGTGGLAEIVRHEEDGYTVLPGDVPSLTTHLIKMLKDEDKARAMAAQAMFKVLTEYNWDQIAANTMKTYEAILHHDSEIYSREAAATIEHSGGNHQ